MMDIDITKELLDLAGAGFDASKELLKFLVITGNGAYSVYKDLKSKYEPIGEQSIKDFLRLGQEIKVTNINAADVKDKKLLQKMCNKYNFSYTTSMVGGNKVFIIPKNKELNFELAYGEYLGILQTKRMLQENMQPVEPVNYKGKSYEIPLNLTDDKAICEKIHGLGTREIKLNPKEIKEIFNDLNVTVKGRSLDKIIDSIDYGQDNVQIKKQLAEQLIANSGMSLGNSDFIVFTADDKSVLTLNLKTKVSSHDHPSDHMQRFNKIVENIKQRNTEFAEQIEVKGWAEEKQNLVNSMYEHMLVEQEDIKQVFDYAMNDEEKTLTPKLRSLWGMVQENTYEKDMLKMDCKEMWDLAYAKRENLSKEQQELLKDKSLNSIQRNVLIEVMKDNPNVSALDIEEIAAKVNTKIPRAAVKENREATDKKKSMDDVNRMIKEQKEQHPNKEHKKLFSARRER